MFAPFIINCQTFGSQHLSLGLETSRDSGIKVLVLVLVLEHLILGLRLGLGTPESWSWSWSWDPWVLDFGSFFVTYKLQHMDYVEFVTTPHSPNSDPWAEVGKNEPYKLLHPLLEKVFATPATSTPVERIFNHSGLLMPPNRTRMGDRLLSQLVYLRCNYDWHWAYKHL